MRLFDSDYFMILWKKPIRAFEIAQGIKVRAQLAEMTNTLLIVGAALIVSSQLLLGVILAVAILLSLVGAFLILAAGWLQLTFKRRVGNSDDV
ncbi:hypothetical protein QTO30_20790 [Yoonia sp. GPGPB17]|uniref:hypothetical protein n=1 Tax=Yoonia sp. GPGPB17 TaxID=3026147 RepID=UPI0030C2F7BA